MILPLPPTAAAEDVVFDVVDALRVPVLIAALLALALVVVELGALAVELRKRKRADASALERAAAAVRDAPTPEDQAAATVRLELAASSGSMSQALARLVAAVRDGGPQAENRVAKTLADFDLTSLRRLERTRFLVRAGPALGLMGTLIPLSPALDGLARGDVQQLSDNLRVAFSITVVGLLTGALAFGISLVRDRLYAQDYSDAEFVAATLTATTP